jgi:hypothetical protein
MSARRGRILAVAGTAALVAGALALPAGAGSGAVEPADLARGADPGVSYLVHDTIRDGALRIPVTTFGVHVRFWEVRGGYLLQDWVQKHETWRLVFIGKGAHLGERRVVGRSPLQMTVAVSPSRTIVAWARGTNELTTPTTVSVADPVTGEVVAARAFRWARVLGVTHTRVLLARRGQQPPTTTAWWSFTRHRVTSISTREAVRADLPHQRIVIATGEFDEPAFCIRVAPLAHPARTLWKSCRWAPHTWSPDGAGVLATHTYFDDVGTDRWLTMGADTGQRLGIVTGRLDWEAVWEDDTHFLTLALGDSGKAGIIRCTVAGTCEGASRSWAVGTATYQPNFIPPPVVLASR